MTRAAAMGGLVALLAGCGATSVQHHLLGRPGVARSGPVRVFLDDAPLPPSMPVALVVATGRGTEADLGHVVEVMRADARVLGCDALVNLRVARGSSVVTAAGFAVRIDPAGVVTTATPPANGVWGAPPPLDAAPDETGSRAQAAPWSAH